MEEPKPLQKAKSETSSNRKLKLKKYPLYKGPIKPKNRQCNEAIANMINRGIDVSYFSYSTLKRSECQLTAISTLRGFLIRNKNKIGLFDCFRGDFNTKKIPVKEIYGLVIGPHSQTFKKALKDQNIKNPQIKPWKCISISKFLLTLVTKLRTFDFYIYSQRSFVDFHLCLQTFCHTQNKKVEPLKPSLVRFLILKERLKFYAKR